MHTFFFVNFRPRAVSGWRLDAGLEAGDARTQSTINLLFLGLPSDTMCSMSFHVDQSKHSWRRNLRIKRKTIRTYTYSTYILLLILLFAYFYVFLASLIVCTQAGTIFCIFLGAMAYVCVVFTLLVDCFRSTHLHKYTQCPSWYERDARYYNFLCGHRLCETEKTKQTKNDRKFVG